MGKRAVCYLCGDPIEGKSTKDHVPPRQFYPAGVRDQLDDLLTLPTHADCNQRFKDDEEYFYQSLSPLAWDTKIGPILKEDMARRYRGGRWEHRERLARMVLREFDRQPGGIWLPAGYVAKRVDPERAKGVLWKIVRGLFFHEQGTILPEDTSYGTKVIGENSLPEGYEAFAELESRATKRNGLFFDYRFWNGDLDGADAYIWGLLLWQKILAVFAFHDPACNCTQCR